jgi:hypothetical protein
MIQSLKSILESGKYSDLTISCGDRVFNVHRAVVCPRSSFFAAACDGKFLVRFNLALNLIVFEATTNSRDDIGEQDR